MSVSLTHCSVLNRLADSGSVQLWHSSLSNRLAGSDGSAPVDSNICFASGKHAVDNDRVYSFSKHQLNKIEI